ncbi:hypothetical protein QQ020_09245 [Fulvivirgaceae bacterium BMA12]|uniref:Integral membrane protein n=1 Tax=Agaribacillus aureus TaxID=3051825 RepID=A0ABT8L4Q9_9BACT|nr:hypothetical protein [Fulvivirgaceae bacterium BMA12]
MKKHILAALASAAVLMIWGMIFWQFIYEPLKIYNTIPNADKVAELLQQSGTVTGTYFYPWPRNTDETFQQFVTKHKEGPFFKLSYIRQGVDPQSPQKMIGGILHLFVVSFLAGLIIRLIGHGSIDFKRKALIIFLAGSIGTVFIQIGDPVWFHLPWDYSLGILVYELISWLILGVITAWIMK